jgi:hypothetical protein
MMNGYFEILTLEQTFEYLQNLTTLYPDAPNVVFQGLVLNIENENWYSTEYNLNLTDEVYKFLELHNMYNI